MSMDTSRHLMPRPDWLATTVEEAIEPELAIIDPHHHLWARPDLHYLAPELLADIATGHRIVATVYLECHSMYREGGDPLRRPLGEIEFAARVAEEAAAKPGTPALCAGIVGNIDIQAGDRVKGLLEAAIEAGKGYFRGIRGASVHHPDPAARGSMLDFPPGLLAAPPFRAGFAHLAPLGLTFDTWMYHTQLDDLVALADAFPDTTIVLNHVGGTIGIGPYAGRRDDVFAEWKQAISRVAERPNVIVKLGGLGMRLFGFDFQNRDRAPTSQELADAWRPYIETCITAFGPDRAMFESNFPVDKGTCSYAVLWNAFKRITSGASADEKRALFCGTAARVYAIAVKA
ncbi:amidohydrolase family protein [Chelatococcus sp. GCM10030263]|uniref:amidohydrolase family protein n=1 Tax=Chelatococcus sp. GCM10030263 TaxID=3273387 RepID=UPI0036204D4B